MKFVNVANFDEPSSILQHMPQRHILQFYVRTRSQNWSAAWPLAYDDDDDDDEWRERMNGIEITRLEKREKALNRRQKTTPLHSPVCRLDL